MAFVYIMASRRNGTLYTGVTNDLGRRAYEHREKLTKGFTSRYSVTQLVYYDVFDRIADAIHREKRIKKWPRDMKIWLIAQMNSEWLDLYETLDA